MISLFGELSQIFSFEYTDVMTVQSRFLKKYSKKYFQIPFLDLFSFFTQLYIFSDYKLLYLFPGVAVLTHILFRENDQDKYVRTTEKHVNTYKFVTFKANSLISDSV